jgi:hypothetical protein
MGTLNVIVAWTFVQLTGLPVAFVTLLMPAKQVSASIAVPVDVVTVGHVVKVSGKLVEKMF